MPEAELMLVELLEERSVSRVISNINAELCYLKPGKYCLVEIDNPIIDRGRKWYVLSTNRTVGASREYWENPNRGIVFKSPKRTRFANPPKKNKPGHIYRQYQGSPAPGNSVTEHDPAP